MKQITYTIEKHIADLSTSPKNGWTRKVNRISWNNRPSKFDIREWSPDGKRMGKGITLSDEEAKKLVEAISLINFDQDNTA